MGSTWSAFIGATLWKLVAAPALDIVYDVGQHRTSVVAVSLAAGDIVQIGGWVGWLGHHGHGAGVAHQGRSEKLGRFQIQSYGWGPTTPAPYDPPLPRGDTVASFTRIRRLLPLACSHPGATPWLHHPRGSDPHHLANTPCLLPNLSCSCPVAFWLAWPLITAESFWFTQERAGWGAVAASYSHLLTIYCPLFYPR